MRLLFATHNKNKFEEIKRMLPEGFHLLSLHDVEFDEDIEETADTIEGNASLKAQVIFEKFGIDCFADDTGLLVDALGGAPGVYSSRYAGDGKSESNIRKLLENLKGAKNRKAHFKTVISLMTSKGETIFTGICNGEITEEPRGTSGFGYDPVFQPEGHELTFAQMDQDLKNKIGHRGKAMKLLFEHLYNL